jgi:hypothetical protein
MSFELLTTIALLCQTSNQSSRNDIAMECRKELIRCVESTPTAIKLAQCVKEIK